MNESAGDPKAEDGGEGIPPRRPGRAHKALGEVRGVHGRRFPGRRWRPARRRTGHPVSTRISHGEVHPGDPKLLRGQIIGPHLPPKGWTPLAGALEVTQPGSELAEVIEASEPAEMSSLELVEAIGACERIRSWAANAQAELVRELTIRHEDAAPDGTGIAVAQTEIAGVLGVTDGAGGRIVGFAKDLAEAPEVQDTLARGDIDVRKAETLITETSTLNTIRARAVQRDALRQAKELTWQQLRARVRKAVLAADGDQANQRHQAAKDERCVILKPTDDGMSWLSFYMSDADAMTVFTALDHLAADSTPGDDRPIAARRVDAAVQIADEILRTGFTPAGDPLPTRQGTRPHLVVTIAASTLAGLDEKPGYLDGVGPIPAVAAREIAARCGEPTYIAVDPESGAYVEGQDPSRASAVTGRTKPPSAESIRLDDAAEAGATSGAGTGTNDQSDASAQTHTTDQARVADQARATDPGAQADAARIKPRHSGVAFGPATGSAGACAPRPTGTDAHELIGWVRSQTEGGRPPTVVIREELGLIASDSYQPSARLRRRVMERDRTCRWRGCNAPAWRCQLDHIVPFDPNLPAWAQTIETNLHLLCRFHHLMKTRSRWRPERDPVLGIVTWTSPSGLTYHRHPESFDPALGTDVHTEVRAGFAGLSPMEFRLTDMPSHVGVGPGLFSGDLTGDGELHPFTASARYGGSAGGEPQGRDPAQRDADRQVQSPDDDPPF